VALTQLAVAAAWSPNPKKPPLYFDMPFGDLQQEVLNKWAANAPLVFVHQYIGDLKQYNAIAMDVGDQDGLRADAAKLHDILDSYGIANTFEIYQALTSAVAVRFQNMCFHSSAKFCVLVQTGRILKQNRRPARRRERLEQVGARRRSGSRQPTYAPTRAASTPPSMQGKASPPAGRRHDCRRGTPGGARYKALRTPTLRWRRFCTDSARSPLPRRAPSNRWSESMER
jgi:hypothetical protein